MAGTTIASGLVNSDFDDLVNDANAARPLTAGGTGGTSQITGWDGLTAQGTAVASASTIVLDTVTGPWIDISGTTTITAVTLGNGKLRLARATGAFQLTASASLVVNNSTSVNYTTTVGDLLIFTAEGGVIRVSVVGSSPQATTSAYGTTKLATLAQTLAQSPAGLVPTIENLYFPTGHLYGLTLSNNAGSAANKIDIAAGTARDDTDSYNYVLTSALTAKDVTSAWAVGSSAGMLDTGAIGNNKYYIWGVGRSDTRVNDALCSLSNTSPTMPTNYNYKVLLGEFTRASATNGAPMWYGPKTAADTAHLGGLKLLTWGTISSAASLNLVLTSYTSYRGIRIVLSGVVPATTNAALWMRFSANGGSTYDSGASNYAYALGQALGTGAFQQSQSTGDTKIIVSGGIDASTGTNGTIIVDLFNWNSSALNVIANIFSNAQGGSGNFIADTGGGARLAQQVANAVQFLFASGNISSGSYAVYGYV